MPDTNPVPLNLEVERSAFGTIAKAQLRIGIAAIGGALVLRNLVPAALVNDQTIDVVTGLVLVGAAAAWSWVRARLTHTRFVSLAVDPAVPDDAVRMKEPNA